MKRGYKKLLIFESILIILFFLNNFVSSILRGYTEIIFLIIMLLSFYFLFGFEKDRHHLWKNVCAEIVIFLLIYFITYYLSGIFLSFARVNNYYTYQGIVEVIIPMILTIVLTEILRYMMLSKAHGSKLIITITCILFIVLNMVGTYNSSTFSAKFTIFQFIAIRLLPTISKNVLCSYISYQVGYKPAILYLLVTELYGYLIPIIPNPNQYLYAVIQLIMPFVLMYKLYKYFKKNEHDEDIERDYHKKKFGRLILPMAFVIFLVYFISGYFHYHAIVVASGSMEPNISKGDVVVIEKIDGNADLLELDQVIAYRYNEIIVVHRLVKIIFVDGEPYFYTKGDANNDIDNYKITKDMIIGIVNVKVPYIGYPTIWVNEL